MTLTPVELADLMQKLANASKTLAEAEGERADSEKARADADKVRADTEKLRSDARESALLTQNRLEVAAADLDAKSIANQKARSDADAARIDKLIEQLSGGVPDLSSLGKSTVTFGEGKALRQGEANALALDSVADKIARHVRATLPNEGTLTVFVTAEPRIVAALAGYWQLKDEADLLARKLSDTAAAAEAALTAAGPVVRKALVAEAGVVAAAVAGKAITQVASLFELEVAVTTSTSDIPAVAVQAAVIQRLLQPPAEGQAAITVQHQWARIPDAQSPLRTVVKLLTDQDTTIAGVDARLQARIVELGDPATTLAQATKDAVDKKKSLEEKSAARALATHAKKELQSLTSLKTEKVNVGAVVAKAKAFAERVSTVSAQTGESPLTAAFSIEPLAAGENVPFVLIVGGAKAETYQMLIKRRIFAPRLQISTALEVDCFLLSGVNVVAASHATASASYQGRVTRWGAMWTKATNLTGPT